MNSFSDENILTLKIKLALLYVYPGLLLRVTLHLFNGILCLWKKF